MNIFNKFGLSCLKGLVLSIGILSWSLAALASDNAAADETANQRVVFANNHSAAIYDNNNTSPFSGFFLGLGGNVAMLTGDYYINFVDIDLNLKEKTGAGINLNTGYGKSWSWFYLGGEAFFNYTPINTEAGEIEYSGHTIKLAGIETKPDYGVALKIGVVPAEKTLLYALLGVDIMDIEVTPLIVDGEQIFSGENRIIGSGVVGLGIEQQLTDKVSLRAQYAYVGGSDVDNFASINFDRLNINRGVFSLGLTYRF